MSQYRHRHSGSLVDAVLYDGSFPLDFLNEGEKVRRADNGACEVEALRPSAFSPGWWVRCPVGHWLVRGEDGYISFYPYSFEALYEPVPERPELRRTEPDQWAIDAKTALRNASAHRPDGVLTLLLDGVIGLRRRVKALEDAR